MRILALLLLSAPAFAQLAGVDAPPTPRARVIGAALPIRRCGEGWRLRREGGCWITIDRLPGANDAPAYVHPGGWIVDGRCFEDRRFDPGEFTAALDAAQKKISPHLTVEHGGCLATFNPVMAKRVSDAVWDKPTVLVCPAYDPKDKFCADTDASPKDFTLIRMRNIMGCVGQGTTGLGGTIFHESLHAAKIDNWPVERHNDVQNIPQYQFVYDRVYGTEATCFFGTDAATRRQANIVQCLQTIAYENPNADRKLCAGFGTYFGDTPQWAK